MRKLLALLFLPFALSAQMTVMGNMGGFTPNLNLNFMTGTMPAGLTFTRTGTATRVNEQGNIETVAANVPRFDYDPASVVVSNQNLVLRSEEFDQASYWSNQGCIITPNAALAPNGQMTADLVAQTATSGRHTVTRSSIAVNPGSVYTASIYLKAGGVNTMTLLFDSGLYSPTFGNVTFDLSTGLIVTGSTAANSTITSVGNGWYRCTSRINTGTNSGLNLSLIVGTGTANITGDGVSGVYYWGVQAHEGATVLPYVATGAANAPGTYTATVLKGLLIEESRTNLINGSSKDFTLSYNPLSATRSVGTLQAPTGIVEADVVTSGTATQSTYNFVRSGGFAGPVGTTYSISIFMKLIGATAASFEIYFGQTTSQGGALDAFSFSAAGVLTSPTGLAVIRPYGNGWYRIERTVTLTSTGNSVGITLGKVPANTSFGYFGYQIEQASTCSSYIPTSAGAVTRGADVCYMSISGWYNQNAGTFAAELTTSPRTVSGNEEYVLYASNTLGLLRGAGSLALGARLGGSTFVSSGITTANATRRLVATYGSGANTVVATGGGLVAGTESAYPASSILYIGCTSALTFQLNGYVRFIRYWPTRRPNPYLQAITN